MLKKILIVIITLLFFIPINSEASHYMGGEITWECLPNGNYRFILKLYRECTDSNYVNSNRLLIDNHPTVRQINLSLSSRKDLSPVCNPNLPNIDCATTQNNSIGAVEEWTWTTDSIYPNGVFIDGVPPIEGWEFYNFNCCRNPNSILQLDNMWYIRAVMYNYTGRIAGVCQDNSPVFTSPPSTVLCSDYPYTYTTFVEDPDYDSLVYSFANPLNDPYSPCVYNSGYNYLSPLPSSTQNPNNIPASLNPETGDINFTSYTTGGFVVTVKIESWRSGELISEVYREIQIEILQCPPNNPPEFIEPFYHPNGTTDFIDTAYVGDFYSFFIYGFDYDSIALPNGLDAQTVTLHTYGNQYGINYTSIGCQNPPCAFLSALYTNGTVSNKQTTGMGIGWQTDTNHYHSNNYTYKFFFSLKDDFCPIPHMVARTVSVLLLPKGLLPPPEARCVNVLNNGDVELNWNKCDTLTENTYESYVVFYSPNINGPYILLDTVRGQWNANTSYTHIGANAQNNNPIYYQIYTFSNSNCGKLLSVNSTNISTIDLNVFIDPTNISNIILEWDHITNPSPATSYNMYYIYKNIVGSPSTLFDSTANTTYTDYSMSVQEIEYSISIKDSSGCSSVSPIIKYKYSGTGLIENNDALKINIFPNPAQNTINFEQYTNENISMSLYDINGKLITSIKKLNKGLTTINISDLASGIYFVKFESKSDISFKKVVVE